MTDSILAFTGSREGVSYAQWKTLHRQLRIFFGTGFRVAFNGCAIGADETAVLLAKEIGYVVEGFPSDVPSQVSKEACEACDILHSAADPLVRNKRMVDAASILLACPAGEEVVRSGTWSTVRYARRKVKPVWLIGPDGVLIRDGGDA